MNDKPPIKANGKIALTRVICTTNGEQAPPTWLARDTIPMPLFLKGTNRRHLLNTKIYTVLVVIKPVTQMYQNQIHDWDSGQDSVGSNYCILSRALTPHLCRACDHPWKWSYHTMSSLRRKILENYSLSNGLCPCSLVIKVRSSRSIPTFGNFNFNVYVSINSSTRTFPLSVCLFYCVIAHSGCAAALSILTHRNREQNFTYLWQTVNSSSVPLITLLLCVFELSMKRIWITEFFRERLVDFCWNS